MGWDKYVRRMYVQKWTAAEKSIKDAMAAVESAGTHPLLTDAVVLLASAFDKVADYTDKDSLTPKHSSDCRCEHCGQAWLAANFGE